MSMIKQNEDLVLERLDHILFDKYIFSQKWQCTTSSQVRGIDLERSHKIEASRENRQENQNW